MQIQVIIVEDEPIEANGEKNRIQRMKCPQIGVIQVFYHAAEAAAYLRTVTDAVLALVDINMPGISGLDFMELMREKSNIRFVIISAYDNFKYAQKAMLFGVRHYLLKPCTFDEFREAVENALQELEESLLLSDFWLEEFDTMAPEKIRADLERVMMAEYPVYCVICFQTPVAEWPDLEKRFRFCRFSGNRLLLLNLPDGARIKDFLAELNARSLTGKAAVSEAGSREELGRLKRQAVGLMGMQAALAPNEIVLYEEEVKKPDQTEEGSGVVSRMKRLAQQQNYPELKILIQRTVAGLSRTCSLFGLETFMESMVQILQKSAVDQAEPPAIDWNLWRYQPDLMASASVFTDYVERIEEAETERKHHKAVKWVIEYSESHLYEKLNMAVLANKMDLNYSYFSQLFKKEMGKTFSEYLNDKRMEAAAEMLLQNKSVETAAKEVGFANTKSFIRAFKEHYAAPPTQWKKKNS